jgi:hypothetical protein
MTELTLTRHAEVRLRHRGLCNADAALLRNVATPLAGDDDAWFLTNTDAAREITRRKREIQQLERLRGVKIVIAGDAVVTAYRPSIKRQRRDLRQHRRHGQ